MKKSFNLISRILGTTPEQVRQRKLNDAARQVNVTYSLQAMWITVAGIPVLRIGEYTDLAKCTIALSEVEGFISTVRDKYADYVQEA